MNYVSLLPALHYNLNGIDVSARREKRKEMATKLEKKKIDFFHSPTSTLYIVV